MRVPRPAARITAVRGWLSSARLCLIIAALLAATACGGANPKAVASPSHPASVAPGSPSPVGSATPAPTPLAASVSCGAKPTGGPMFLVGGLLYDVTDPAHPRRLCATANTSAHIWTLDSIAYLKADTSSSTAVVLHSIGSGNETVPFHIPYPNLQAPGPFATTWWGAAGTIAATTIQPAQASPGDQTHVWVYTPSFTGQLFSYPHPLTDCICRFGLPQPVLSISPDHQFLVAGWPIGKGAQGLSVYRLSDRSLVTSFDTSIAVALWDKSGHRLYLSGTSGSVSWTPEGGQVALAGSQQWSYLAGLSPDATQVAYTAYLDPNTPTSIRVFVYDLKTQQTRMLRDAWRSQVVFVKPGWVWYLEETTCDSCAGGTKSTGKVLAMNLADGVERPVDFLYAEDTSYIVPGEFWPNA